MNLITKISSKHVDVVTYIKRLLQVDGGDGPQVFSETETGLSFLSGLVPYINTKMVEDGLDFQIPFSRDVDMGFEIDDMRVIFQDFEDRDPQFDSTREYQHQAALKCLRMKRGLCSLPTGSGKSDVAACILRILVCRGKKILMLNDRIEILRQTKKRYVRRGIPSDYIAIFGDDNFDAPITLCSVAAVYTAIKEKDANTKKMLSEADVLLFDEAHHIGANSWLSICKRAKKAEYLLGFSGSCYWDRRNPYSNYRDLVTTGITGGIICAVSSPFLREQGYLATPFVHMLEYAKDGIFLSRDWHLIQDRFIVNNLARNEAAIRIIAYLDRLGLKTLVLVTIIEHGHNLLKLCAERGIKAVFNSGGDTLSVWDNDAGVVKVMKGDLELVKQLLSSGVNIVVGSTVYDEGVDIPDIDCGVFLSGGKSPIKLLQRVGRIVRKKSGVNKALLFDMNDGGENYTMRSHRQKRVTEYVWEQIEQVDLTQAMELAQEIGQGKNVGG